MPFSTRVVPNRTQIPDLYGHAAQNILEKNNVSDMVGLLQQLNVVSKYASEVFGDIFAITERNHQRIEKVKSRLRNIEQHVPKQEALLVRNSPMFFYDNPYMGTEFQRKDPNQGLLFRRDRCTNEVNRRRLHGEPIPDFSSLDQFSKDGQPNAVKYSDARFFINEWLAAEERKIKEEKRRRKQMREEKRARREKSGKSGKQQRQKVKVLAVSKKRFDANTGKAIVDDDDQKHYAKTTDYQLSDNSTISSGKRVSMKPKSQKVSAYQSPQMKQQNGGQRKGVGGPAPSSPKQRNNVGGPPPHAQQPGPPPGNVGGPPAPPVNVGGPPGGPGGPPPPPVNAGRGPTPPPQAYGAGNGPAVQLGDAGGGGQMMGVPQSHMKSMPSYGNPMGQGPPPVQQIQSMESDVSESQYAPPARPAFMQAVCLFYFVLFCIILYCFVV